MRWPTSWSSAGVGAPAGGQIDAVPPSPARGLTRLPLVRAAPFRSAEFFSRVPNAFKSPASCPPKPRRRAMLCHGKRNRNQLAANKVVHSTLFISGSSGLALIVSPAHFCVCIRTVKKAICFCLAFKRFKFICHYTINIPTAIGRSPTRRLLLAWTVTCCNVSPKFRLAPRCAVRVAIRNCGDTSRIL